MFSPRRPCSFHFHSHNLVIRTEALVSPVSQLSGMEEAGVLFSSLPLSGELTLDLWGKSLLTHCLQIASARPPGGWGTSLAPRENHIWLPAVSSFSWIWWWVGSLHTGLSLLTVDWEEWCIPMGLLWGSPEVIYIRASKAGLCYFYSRNSVHFKKRWTWVYILIIFIWN